ncbi:MAG: hypothetical protein ACLT4C_02095 [Butyricicoccus sp.]
MGNFADFVLSYAESRSRACCFTQGALFYSLGMPDWGSIRGTAAAALLLLLYNSDAAGNHTQLNKAFCAAYPRTSGDLGDGDCSGRSADAAQAVEVLFVNRKNRPTE